MSAVPYPTLLIVLLSLWSSALALKCYQCSDSLAGPENTCNSEKRTVTESQFAGSQCRTYVYGGYIVSQDLVDPSLCSPIALQKGKQNIPTLYRGSGEYDAYCCASDYCNEAGGDDKSAAAAYNSGNVLVGIATMTTILLLQRLAY